MGTTVTLVLNPAQFLYGQREGVEQLNAITDPEIAERLLAVLASNLPKISMVLEIVTGLMDKATEPEDKASIFAATLGLARAIPSGKQMSDQPEVSGLSEATLNYWNENLQGELGALFSAIKEKQQTGASLTEVADHIRNFLDGLVNLEGRLAAFTIVVLKLTPYWVSKTPAIPFEQLNDHMEALQPQRDVLKITLDRAASSYDVANDALAVMETLPPDLKPVYLALAIQGFAEKHGLALSTLGLMRDCVGKCSDPTCGCHALWP